MSLSFGGPALAPTKCLLRVLSWDPSVVKDLKTWVATRGVPADYDDNDLRAKFALKLFEQRRKDAALDPRYNLGMVLHLMRGPELPFPPGTLFEQREVVPAVAGNPPRTVRITDSSGGWQYLRNRVLEGGLLHVANIHKDALLPPSQGEGYLGNLADNELTLDKVKDIAGPGQFDLDAGAIVTALDPASTRPAYWAHAGHKSEYTEAANAREFYSFKHVATFREYCEFLWNAAKVIWAMGRGKAKPADLEHFSKAAAQIPDNSLTVEQKGEVYASMQDLAQYLRAAGATSDAPYFAAGGKCVPGQQNLLDIAYYWVTHATDASDPRDVVGRNESNIMARYLNACYDFFQWAGAAGLFAFHKVGAKDEVASITDAQDVVKIKEVLADLQAIAGAEGLNFARLKTEETEFTRNPRLHARTPWSSLTSSTKERVGKDETVNRIEKNILYHRVAKVFGLLRLRDWKKFTDRGVGTLVRQALEYADLDEKNASGKRSGFAWIRRDLVMIRKTDAAVATPPDLQEKSRKKKGAKKRTKSGSYLDLFTHLSYRYILNYIGGHLHFFRQYIDRGARERTAFWMRYCKELHPLNRWRLYLEIAYMVTLLTQRTAPKEEARSMSRLIQEVLPVVAGDGTFVGLPDAVKKVTADRELEGDTVVREFEALIQQKEWVELVDRLYRRLVAERARERGSAKAEQEGGTPRETPRQKYFRELQDATMLFTQKRLGTVLLLRHFYRTLYFYLPPEVPDFLPPMYLDRALDKDSFAMLLDQEAIATRYLGRRPTGGKFRIRVAVPVEVAAWLSTLVIDPETGAPLEDLPGPVEGPREALLAGLPGRTDLPDRDYRLVLRFYKDDGTETCFAINEHVWHAAQHELNRRLCNHVYNCQVLAARLAQGKKVSDQFDKAVDVIAKVANQQAEVIKAGAGRRVAITNALLNHLPESFPALASFAFRGRLPKGFVTALKRAEKATAFEIDSMARHLRNLSDASNKKDDPGEYYTFDGKFPHILGQKLNRRRLAPRLDRAYRLAAAPYRGGKETKKNQRMLDILGWARAKRLILHFRQEADVQALAAFADAWGRADPLKIVNDLARDARTQVDLFADNYPNFSEFPPYPDGKAPATTFTTLNTPITSKGEENKPLSRDAILLAVMKALVLAAEQDLAGEKGLSFQVSRNVKAKLLQMIYAHEFLVGQTSEAEKAELEDNDLLPGGLRFLVDAPALIPSIALAKTLGWAVSDIVRNPHVVEKSLGQPLPTKVSGKDTLVNKETGSPVTLGQAETHRMDSFASPRKNYSDAVQEVISILAAAQAFGATEGDWKKFVTRIDERWVTRWEQVATGDDTPMREENLFEDLQRPANKAWNEFAKVVGKGLDEVQNGNARSLKADNHDKLRPLPLSLSSESPTLGKIQDFRTIEDHLRGKVVVPFAKVFQDLEVVSRGGHWQVEMGGQPVNLTGGFRPGSVPFVINVKPLDEEVIRKHDAFFGGKAKNPLRPEIDIEGHCVGERDTRDGELAKWKSSYATREKDAENEIEAVLTAMHQLREYKIGIERRLAARTDTVLDLARLGYSPEKIAQELRARDMSAKVGGKSIGLTQEEGDAVKEFLQSWKSDKDDPAKLKALAKSIIKDNLGSPGKRVDEFLGDSKSAKKRAMALGNLLGGLTITTWKGGEFPKAAARGEKLAGIIASHLARLGFRLRALRAQRDFYLASIERINRAGKDEARLGKKQADLTAKAFASALDRLRQPGLFLAFRDGGILPCEVPLAKGLPAAREVDNNGNQITVYDCKGRLLGKVLGKATLDGIQVQVPLYPSGTVAANVFVKGTTLVAHAPTSLAKWLEDTFKGKNDKNLVSSLDLNRLNCARTITPGLIAIVGSKGNEHPADPKDKIEDWNLEFDHWARLADVYDYTRDRPNQYVGRETRSKGGGSKHVYPAAAFYRRVIAAAFAPAGESIGLGRPDPSSTVAPAPAVDETTQPSGDAPYDVDAVKVKLNFRDKLGALMKYRGAKHAHLERKKPAIARKKKRLEGSPAKQGHFLRARTALYFINRACNHVRDADLAYLFRSYHYCQKRSRAAFIAHENLALGTGNEEGLGGIVASMLKDFKPLKSYLVRQLRGLECEQKDTPKMDGVSPAYTSQRCNHCARLGITGTLDDSASADHAICDKCGRVYDRHGSAASNIGDRFVKVKFGKKKTTREKGDPKEGKG